MLERFILFACLAFVVVLGFPKINKSNFTLQMAEYNLPSSVLSALLFFYRLFYAVSALTLLVSLFVLIFNPLEGGDSWTYAGMLYFFAISVGVPLGLSALYLIFILLVNYLIKFWSNLHIAYYGGLLGSAFGLFILGSAALLSSLFSLQVLRNHPLLSTTLIPFSSLERFNGLFDYPLFVIIALLYTFIAIFFLIPIPAKYIQHIVVISLLLVIELITFSENDLVIVRLFLTVPFVLGTLLVMPFQKIVQRNTLNILFGLLLIITSISYFIF